MTTIHDTRLATADAEVADLTAQLEDAHGRRLHDAVTPENSPPSLEDVRMAHVAAQG